MLTLYSTDSKAEETAATGFGPDVSVVSRRQWTRFVRITPRSDCSIALIRNLRVDRMIGRLAAFRQRYPTQPLVLATKRDARNLRQIRRLRLDEIVWWHELGGHLPEAVRQAKSTSFLWQQAARFQDAEELPSMLRQALTLACRTEQPIRGVGALAEAVGCDRRTLWRQWRQVTSTADIKELLGWFQLIQGVAAKTQGKTQQAVARELGISLRSLGPIAKRMADVPFGQLASKGTEEAIRRFREDMKGRAFDKIVGCDILG